MQPAHAYRVMECAQIDFANIRKFVESCKISSEGTIKRTNVENNISRFLDHSKRLLHSETFPSGFLMRSAIRQNYEVLNSPWPISSLL